MALLLLEMAVILVRLATRSPIQWLRRPLLLPLMELAGVASSPGVPLYPASRELHVASVLLSLILTSQLHLTAEGLHDCNSTWHFTW